MVDQYVGEIRLFAGTWIPQDWLACNGAELSAAAYPVLCDVLKDTWGGDGVTTFKLPDLRGRVCVGAGKNTASSTSYLVGQTGGTESVQLTLNQIPTHTHMVQVQDKPATTNVPGPTMTWATTPATPLDTLYGATPATTPMAAGMIGYAGADQPHDNMQPSLALGYIIAAIGLHPSTNRSAS